jgi:gliding motility-associated-like protein
MLAMAPRLPRHQYARPGTYLVRLNGRNAAGCPVVATTPVVVGELLISNISTPNGDGKNDILHLPGVPADTASLEVYSRWGTRVYTAARYAHDWDGGTLPAGVYYYLLREADCAAVSKGGVEQVR